MSYTKFWPDRFSRFDVYWIETNKQTNKHLDKPNLYIDEEKIGTRFINKENNDYIYCDTTTIFNQLLHV